MCPVEIFMISCMCMVIYNFNLYRTNCVHVLTWHISGLSFPFFRMDKEAGSRCSMNPAVAKCSISYILPVVFVKMTVHN